MSQAHTHDHTHDHDDPKPSARGAVPRRPKHHAALFKIQQNNKQQNVNPNTLAPLCLNYSSFGRHDAPHKLLLIMGLWQEGNSFHKQASYFASKPDFQVVYYDNRGVGLSSSSPLLDGRCTTSVMATDAVTIANHLGEQWSRFHLVGVSMGGMIAQEVALMIPDRLLSLTLIVTHAGGRIAKTPPNNLISSMFEKDPSRRAILGMERLYSPVTLEDEERHRQLFDYQIKRIKTRQKPQLWGMLGHVLAVWTHFVDWRHLLHLRFSAFRTLFITGDTDNLVETRNTHLMHSVVGGEKLVLSAGHGILVEKHEEVSKAIEKHVLAAAASFSKTGPVAREALFVSQWHALDLCCHHRLPCFVHAGQSFLGGLTCFASFITLLYIVSPQTSTLFPSFLSCSSTSSSSLLSSSSSSSLSSPSSPSLSSSSSSSLLVPLIRFSLLFGFACSLLTSSSCVYRSSSARNFVHTLGEGEEELGKHERAQIPMREEIFKRPVVSWLIALFSFASIVALASL